MENIVIVLLTLSATLSTLGLRGIYPEKLTCEPNPTECYESTCNMTKLTQFKFNISFGCNLKQSQPKLSVRLQLFRKIKQNKYVPAFFDSTFDLCSLNVNNDAMFKTFLPGMKQQIEKYMNGCPYSASGVVKPKRVFFELFYSVF
jgi:Protein of unknown function (DUF1091)